MYEFIAYVLSVFRDSLALVLIAGLYILPFPALI